MPKLCFSFFFLIILHLLLTSELSFGFPNCNKNVSDTLSKNSRKSASFTLYIRNKLTQLHYVSSLMKLSSKWDLFSALYNSSSNFGKLCPLMLCNCFTEICCHAVLPLRNICPTLSLRVPLTDCDQRPFIFIFYHTEISVTILLLISGCESYWLYSLTQKYVHLMLQLLLQVSVTFEQFFQ